MLRRTRPDPGPREGPRPVYIRHTSYIYREFPEYYICHAVYTLLCSVTCSFILAGCGHIDMASVVHTYRSTVVTALVLECHNYYESPEHVLLVVKIQFFMFSDLRKAE